MIEYKLVQHKGKRQLHNNPVPKKVVHDVTVLAVIDAQAVLGQGPVPPNLILVAVEEETGWIRGTIQRRLVKLIGPAAPKDLAISQVSNLFERALPQECRAGYRCREERANWRVIRLALEHSLAVRANRVDQCCA